MTMKSPQSVIGSSASDCEIDMMLFAGSNPVTALQVIGQALNYMNARGIEKASHRSALMKAGRKALKQLGEM